jgi:tRNA (mo5U34)-methyltransferase
MGWKRLASGGPKALEKFGCPSDLRGKTVLDIGAADGGYSFQAEQRGASRVMATDSWLWGDGPDTSKAAFDFAREALGSKVESRHIDVLDHSPATVGIFDIVLFLGVLYHMRHPLLALERVYSVTGDQLILDTHLDMLDCDRPAMAFYPGKELNNDSTNWCGPNALAVEAMLRTVGFRHVELFFMTSYGEMRNVYDSTGVKPPHFNWEKIDLSGNHQARAVFYAWR